MFFDGIFEKQHRVDFYYCQKIKLETDVTHSLFVSRK